MATLESNLRFEDAVSLFERCTDGGTIGDVNFHLTLGVGSVQRRFERWVLDLSDGFLLQVWCWSSCVSATEPKLELESGTVSLLPFELASSSPKSASALLSSHTIPQSRRPRPSSCRHWRERDATSSLFWGQSLARCPSSHTWSSGCGQRRLQPGLAVSDHGPFSSRQPAGPSRSCWGGHSVALVGSVCSFRDDCPSLSRNSPLPEPFSPFWWLLPDPFLPFWGFSNM